MTALHQLVAIETGIKSKASRLLTDTYRKIGSTPILSGITRTYQPLDEENGEMFSPERVNVQVTIESLIVGLIPALAREYDVILSKETTNAGAKADIVVAGVVLVPDAPVTFILPLEKKLVDLHTFVQALPTLDPAEDWEVLPDPATGAWVTLPVQTTKTKKIEKPVVLYPATKEHQAQVKMVSSDDVVGYWTKKTFSGALPAVRKAELLVRVEALQEAVKIAREEANKAEVIDRTEGAAVINYLLGV